MKQNKYDQETFFQKYSEMHRSIHGLEGAGEWSTLQPLLPSFKDTTILDLGCGYGWHCEYALQQGAKHVTGCDLSEKMIAVAKQKCAEERASFICGAMEDISFDKEQFDCVLSSLAIHYIKEYPSLVNKIYEYLKVDGTFVFSVEHPIFTSSGTQDWHYNDQQEIVHFPVDRYFYEGKRTASFLGEEVVKYHRTLTTYIDTLLRSGFSIERIVEPQPPTHLMEVEGMKDEMRRPMMLIIVAKKKK